MASMIETTMIETTKQLLISQYEAALSTLSLCAKSCPDEHWQRPVVRYPFSQVVYHTLFFLDYYLGPNEDSFRQQPFHLENAEWFADYEQIQDREPTSTYERADIAKYFAHGRAKVSKTIDQETETSLAGPCNFARRDFSRAELHVYNIRHVQHHAAQLILKLRADEEIDIPWVGEGWRD